MRSKIIKLITYHIILVQGIVILILYRQVTSKDDERKDNTTDHVTTKQLNNEDEICSLYLAISSIPNAGLGIFTGRSIEPFTSIPSFSDIAIPLYDIHGYHQDEDFWWLIQSYHWNSVAVIPPEQLKESHQISFHLPYSSAANGHTGIDNVALSYAHFGLVGLNRSKDPGAGSVSPYSDVDATTKAKKLEAGQELFLAYGDNWFKLRKSYIGEIPLSKHYKEADQIVSNFIAEHNYTNITSESIGLDREHELQFLWNDVKEEVISPGVKNALPDSIHELPFADEVGSAELLVSDTLRSTNWLKKNGYCLDNIRIAHSQIPQAGRGAIATKILKKGSIIAPIPLIHTNRNAMKMKGENGAYQLLINYCFGHKTTSLILCPYGSIGHLINHASGSEVEENATLNHNTPNAALRWASKSNSAFQRSWLSLSVKSIMEKTHAGLMLEIIALRDIKPNEEVLIDYGIDWEKAWQNHVKNWKPATNAQYIPATMLNEDPTSIIRTKAEQSITPYPPNIRIECEYNHQPTLRRNNNFLNESKLTISKRFRDVADQIENTIMEKYLRPCVILTRRKFQISDESSNITTIYAKQNDESVYLYSARMLNNHDSDDIEQRIPDNEIHIIEGIPRHKIIFLDTPYSTDPQQTNVFRKEISLPDYMIPTPWKMNN